MSNLGASQIPAMYRAAMKRYEEITKEKLDHREWLKLRSVEGLIEEIDNNNKAFDEFRATRHTLFSILRGTMNPIELAGNLGSGAASVAFPPSSIVFGAVSYLVNSAKGVSADYDSIRELMLSMKEFTVRLSIYSQEQISDELSDKLTSIFVTLMEIFALSKKAMSRGRVLALGRRIVLGGDSAVQEAVAKLAQLTRTEDSLVGAESLTGIKTVGRTVDGIDATVTSTNVVVREIEDNVNHISLGIGNMSLGMADVTKDVRSLVSAFDETKIEAREQKEESRRDRIKRVLQPSVNAQDWYAKIDRSRLAGTGDWIREEKEFKSWAERRTPLLWINGIPGSGKSYLSSNMITFLQENYPQGVRHPSNISVGYFFFRHDSPDTRSFHQALRDMAFQICQNDPLYAKDIDANCKSPEDINTLESAWRELFVKSRIQKESVSSRTFLIMDGIDEANEAELQSFLELASDLAKERNQKVYLAMVGRPQLGDLISEALGVQVPTIHVTEAKNSADIAHYIEASIQKSNVLRRVSKGLRAEIVEKLLAGARGMFLWVDLILRELMKSRGGSESGIRKKLGEAPKGLTKMFCHVLEGFSSSCGAEESDNLNEILAWTTCAARPLKLKELDALLRLSTPEGDGMIYLEGALRVQFASFFYLAREDGRTTVDIQAYGNAVNNELDYVLGQPEEPAKGTEDIGNETYFESDQNTTEVTFCHASIGDFFRDEGQGMVSAGDGNPLVGVNYTAAKIKVLITCLKLLCDDALRASRSGDDMRPYAFKNWQNHLDQVEPSSTSVAEKIVIASFLAKMFGLQSVAGNWVGAKNTAWFNKENVQRIRRWFNDKEVLESLPPEDQAWIESTSTYPAKTFLQPIGRLAKGWLEETEGWKPLVCCKIVYAYINFEKGLPFDESFTGLTTAEEIIAVAKWPKLAETATWHLKLGFTLQEQDLYHEALIYFEKALQLDDTMRSARAERAKIYNKQLQMDKTLEIDIESEKRLMKATLTDSGVSAEAKAALHEVRERLGPTYLFLGDKKSALDCSQRALSNDPICDRCMLLCLMVLLEEERWSEIIEVFQKLDAEKAVGMDCSLLIQYLVKNEEDASDRHFLTAAYKTGELKFLIKSYRSAIRLARTTLGHARESVIGFYLAHVYYTYNFDEPRAVHILEEILKRYSTLKEESEMAAKKREISASLADHWFKTALDTRVHSHEAEGYIKKLESLAKGKSRVLVDPFSPLSKFPALLLGLWHRLCGHVDEARALFYPSVMEGLQILSDDDPDNDQAGFMWLSMVLLAAGDFKNCIATCHSYAVDTYEVIAVSKKVQARRDGSGHETSPTIQAAIENVVGIDIADWFSPDQVYGPDHEAKIDFALKLGMIQAAETSIFVCDGPCGRSLPGLVLVTKTSPSTTYEYYRCHYCLMVAFCGDCLKLLKEGNMPLNICSSKHQWLAIPLPSELPKDGKMIVEAELIDFEEWKRGLRDQWNG